MKTAALEAEMRRALANLAHEHIAELVGAGVPIYPIAIHQMIGAEVIRFTGDEYYCPDPDGKLAFITPIRVQFPETPQSSRPWEYVRTGDPIDLLAWDPSERDWALRAGAADCLGCTEIQDYPDLIEPGPTRLWRTPLHWFRDDCAGLVILSRDRGEIYRILAQLHGGIEAEDDAHARELRAVLKRPWPAPSVRIARQGHRTEARRSAVIGKPMRKQCKRSEQYR
jgi:hypothetical protein